MQRSLPPSDWVVYVVVLGTVAAMLVGKWLMFFNDKENQESEASQLDDTVEDILEETMNMKERLDEVIK